MQHPPRFWKHKESKEVIDNDTYRDLDELHRSDFDECDVTGEFINFIDLDEIERLATMPVGENNEPVIANEEGNTENNTDGSTTTP